MSSRTVAVILNWNSGEMTAECIRSLLAMDSSDYEMVVVDNGSSDGSAEYLRRGFPEITVLRQEHNLGFAGGCNVGLQYALDREAEFILLLNNDTVVCKNFVRGLVEQARAHRKAGMVSPKIYFWDLPDRFWWAGGAYSLWSGLPKHIGRKEKDNGQFEVPRQIDWATGCAVLIRTAALKTTGLFDPQIFGNGEDLDLSLRMKRAGYEIWYAPKARLWHKEGVDYRKNVGEHVRKFTGTRNLLWIMHKHARTVQWVSFLPNFLCRYVLFYVLLSLSRGDFRSAKAVLKGVWAFLRMRAHPAVSPLPAGHAEHTKRISV